MADEPPRLRLVSDRPKGSDFESFPRIAVRPRYRQGALAPWRPKLIEATAVDTLQAQLINFSVQGFVERPALFLCVARQQWVAAKF
jgi:hypothetical protein